MIKREKSAVVQEEQKTQLLNENPSFDVAEAYKTLRTNIIFSLPGSGGKCVIVTSAEQGEDKSANCANVAMSFAQLGKKVLLVDADMRRQTPPAMLGDGSRSGLSDLLVGKAKPEDVCVWAEDYGLTVLPAGTVPPDPTRLLGSEQMAQALKNFKEQYDYVLLDFPPVNTVTDAMILSQAVDGYLLVVKRNVTKLRAIDEMVSRIQMVNGKILGFLYTNDEPVLSQRSEALTKGDKH